MAITNKYGDIAHFKFGRQHVYLLNNPQFIEDVLVKNHKNFTKSRGLQVSKRLLGEGLVTSEGKYHDRQRRIIQPAFLPNLVKKYGEIVTAHSVNMCRDWKDEEKLDIHRSMINLTSSIISKAVLGSDIQSAEGSQVGDDLLTCAEYFNRLLMPFGELIEKIPILPINKGFQKAKKRLDSIVFNMIQEHRNNTANERPKSDLLYTLLEAQDSDAGIKRMTDTQLRDEVMTIFLAGHETTANALAWTFYLLSTHPQIERRLREELDRVLGDRPPALEDLGSLTYLTQVLKESMRLYPPAWTIDRHTIADDEVMGYRIRKDSLLLVSPFVTHRHPAFWPNPEGFDPDRFAPELEEARPRYAYFPFGGGPRMCIGSNFAMME